VAKDLPKLLRRLAVIASKSLELDMSDRSTLNDKKEENKFESCL